jgi:hypothetical protein
MKRALIVLAAAVALAGCIDIGNGEKVGVVTRAVDGSGVFCKTMEVEVTRGGMNAGTGVVGAPFHATVVNRKDFDVLVKAMESQEEVKIKYSSELATFCRSDSAGHFITSVEPARPVGVTRPAPVAVSGPVAVTKADNAAPVNETRDQRIQRLLATQAELLKELSINSTNH